MERTLKVIHCEVAEEMKRLEGLKSEARRIDDEIKEVEQELKTMREAIAFLMASKDAR